VTAFRATGVKELPDGTTKPFCDVIPDLEFRDDNRPLLSGTLRCVLVDGLSMSQVEPGSRTCHPLGTGLYGGFEGHYQGVV
jgi:hypothetical protein